MREWQDSFAPFEAQAQNEVDQMSHSWLGEWIKQAHRMSAVASYIDRLERELVTERTNRMWYQAEFNRSCKETAKSAGHTLAAVLAGISIGGTDRSEEQP